MTSKKLFISLLACFSIILISCKKEATTIENSAKTEDVEILEDTIQPIRTETEAETVALNPPHGQPNHRCDIAVGAPLNTVPSPSSFLKPTQQTPATNNTGVKPKLNPAHGQPHHRCDLQVGDPLPDK